MHSIDAAEYRALKNGFEQIKVSLMITGKRLDHQGAMARAMLHLIPALLLFVERERKINTAPEDLRAGATQCIADILKNMIRLTTAPAGRGNALDRALREINTAARERLLRDHGIVLPSVDID